jgi:hypothetical protein
MPRKRKKPHEMTSDELAKSLFPPKVIKHVKKTVGTDLQPAIKKKFK